MYGISTEFIAKIQSCIEAAIDITCTAYHYLSPDIQETIALNTSFIFGVDDLVGDLRKDLQEYATTLTLGQPQKHELLRGYTEFISGLCRFLGTFGGNMVIKSTVDFISSNPIEDEQDLFHLSLDTSNFPTFFRYKTGISEPYSFFLFPEDRYPEEKYLHKYLPAIPTLISFFDQVNDLLSFYKEEFQTGDSVNFINTQARLHSITPLESLKRTQTSAVELVQKIRRIFESEPEMLKDMETFMQGYVLFHLSAKRYRLAELNIPASIECTKRFNEAKLNN